VGEANGGEAERLHVFSLATGHLYERFLKVMMMSVVKRASMPVTFWLLENFLSSSFKESAQALAEEFGFRVEFVTYKWPEWLRRQSEKQRIIWGYKILFLDVLFPLSVDKVIYVDADQVPRLGVFFVIPVLLHRLPPPLELKVPSPAPGGCHRGWVFVAWQRRCKTSPPP
ncbi:unnamed protein product, partial [Ectocarpus sp. 13 AM-2016]